MMLSRPARAIRLVLLPLALVGGLVVAPAPASASCTSVPVTRGAYLGYAKCGTTVLDWQFSNTIKETFVVGTTSSNNIYHIWQRYPGDPTWTGWQTLPGNGTAINGVYVAQADPLVVKVWGTDNRYYCNQRGTTWSGWSTGTWVQDGTALDNKYSDWVGDWPIAGGTMQVQFHWTNYVHYKQTCTGQTLYDVRASEIREQYFYIDGEHELADWEPDVGYPSNQNYPHYGGAFWGRNFLIGVDVVVPNSEIYDHPIA